MKARTITEDVVFFLVLLVAILVPASIMFSVIIEPFTTYSGGTPTGTIPLLVAGVILLLLLTVGAIILAALGLSRLSSRWVKWVRIVLYVIVGLLLASCIWRYAQSVWHVFKPPVPYHGWNANSWLLANVMRSFYWYVSTMAFFFLLVLLPATRSHRDVTATATLFVVSVCLPLTITAYLPVIWHPHFDFEFYVHHLLPPLLCLAAAALWYGLQFLLAFLRQRNDKMARIIGALVAFHLLSVCLHTFLVGIAFKKGIAAFDPTFRGIFAPSQRAKLTVKVVDDQGRPQPAHYARFSLQEDRGVNYEVLPQTLTFFFDPVPH